LDLLSALNFARDVHEDAVSQLHRIEEAQQRYRRFVLPRIKAKNPLARHRCIGIFAKWCKWSSFNRAAAAHLAERINITSGKPHDSRAMIPLHDPRWNDRVHRPGRRRVFSRAEFQTD